MLVLIFILISIVQFSNGQITSSRRFGARCISDSDISSPFTKDLLDVCINLCNNEPNCEGFNYGKFQTDDEALQCSFYSKCVLANNDMLYSNALTGSIGNQVDSETIRGFVKEPSKSTVTETNNMGCKPAIDYYMNNLTLHATELYVNECLDECEKDFNCLAVSTSVKGPCNLHTTCSSVAVRPLLDFHNQNTHVLSINRKISNKTTSWVGSCSNPPILELERTNVQSCFDLCDSTSTCSHFSLRSDFCTLWNTCTVDKGGARPMFTMGANDLENLTTVYVGDIIKTVAPTPSHDGLLVSSASVQTGNEGSCSFLTDNNGIVDSFRLCDDDESCTDYNSNGECKFSAPIVQVSTLGGSCSSQSECNLVEKCIAGTCTSPIDSINGLGERCDVTRNPCEIGLTCNEGRCGEAAETSISLANKGDDCTDSSECFDTLECLVNDDEGNTVCKSANDGFVKKPVKVKFSDTVCNQIDTFCNEGFYCINERDCVDTRDIFCTDKTCSKVVHVPFCAKGEMPDGLDCVKVYEYGTVMFIIPMIFSSLLFLYVIGVCA